MCSILVMGICIRGMERKGNKDRKIVIPVYMYVHMIMYLYSHAVLLVQNGRVDGSSTVGAGPCTVVREASAMWKHHIYHP